jgi:NAD+ kinase
MKSKRYIAVIYNPWRQEAKTLAESLATQSGPMSAMVVSLDELDARIEDLKSCDVLVSVGGDGTILRIVRATAFLGIPLLGVNLGRVGFMTELLDSEVHDRFYRYFDGSPWIEERTMLDVCVTQSRGALASRSKLPIGLHALNEAVVGRGSGSRPIWVDVKVDGTFLTGYSADAVIVATATGSSGYSLSSGGPIIYPGANVLLLKPVSPQLSLDTGIVIDPSSVLDLELANAYPGQLSVDGIDTIELDSGDHVNVRRSALVARFLRIGERKNILPRLGERLGSPATLKTNINVESDG